MQNTNFPTYVFATVNPAQANRVIAELKQNSNIELVAPVTGRYDLVLRLKQAPQDQVYQWVQSIRQIQGVQSTITTMGFNGFTNGKLQNQLPLGITFFNATSSFDSIISQLKNFPGLVEAWTTPGQSDILALWQAKTTDEIVKTTVEKLPTLQGISRSETLLASSLFIHA